MDMSFYMPTDVRTGRGCLAAGGAALSRLGARCLVVTGKTSARASGALDDLAAVLAGAGIAYTVFDGIGQNPTYAACLAAAGEAKAMGAEFIIGIGGGSPLDAAKAVAVLTACRDTSAEALFSCKWDADPLPIVAIGTTAGTGSEVTPVAVITTPAGRKTSIRAASLYPTVTFGDAAYTASLSPAFTRSTALDALAHCLESYYNRTANDISRTYAARGVAILAEMLEKTATADTRPLTEAEREALYISSLYAGLAISVTGTAFPHALGYFLSEEHGIPHGNACAVYLEAFIRHNEAVAPSETHALSQAAGITPDGLCALVGANLPPLAVTLTEDDLAALAPRFADNKSLKKCLGSVDQDYATALLRQMFVAR